MQISNIFVFFIKIIFYFLTGIRKQVIKVIYSIASKTAEKYIKSHLTEFKLGGPGIVVLIETYPDANSSINPQPYTSNTRPILCIAEIKVRLRLSLCITCFSNQLYIHSFRI